MPPAAPVRHNVPASREDAITKAEELLKRRQPNEDMQETIRRFAKEHRLADEVELGLRLLGDEPVRRLLGSPTLRGRIREASDPHEAMLREMVLVDAEVEAIVRALMGKGGKERKEKKEDKEKKHRKHHSESHKESHKESHRERRRSRSRHGRRRTGGEEEKSSHRHRHRHSNGHSSRDPAASSSAPPQSSGGGGGHHERSSRHGEDRHRRHSSSTAAGGAARGGVWGAPEEEPELSAPRPKSAAVAAQVAMPKSGGSLLPRPKSAGLPPPPQQQPLQGQSLEEWVRGLDGGRGAMLKYFPAIESEFGDFSALAATVLPQQKGGSVVGWIDACLWDALGVEALGHKLTLAKGIVALSKSMGGPGG